jgi:ribosomal protein S12 methylthiotransferase
MKYYLASLGCSKNLVDAHGMSRLLQEMGHRPVDDPRRAQVLVVNTCGFIEDAREESLDELRQLAREKRPGQVLIAAGCLSQRWGDRLMDAVPGLDGMLGTRRWVEIESLIRRVQADSTQRSAPLGSARPAWLGDGLAGDDHQQSFARQGASAYLKIADGCSAPCAFCAIPLIKGPAASRQPADVVRDAVDLVHQGAKEIVLIAQDTTAYGRDLGERDALPDLIEDILEAAPELHWLRLMYAYPGHVSPRLIELMAGDPRICHYLDLPLQHAHPAVLRRMKRPSDVKRTRDLVASLRAAMPDLALRTSFIVGYPGETEAEFDALLNFVQEIRFDRLGVFLYSPEEGTAAASLPDPVPEEVQIERQDRLMALQQQISLQINQAQIGRTLDVLIEGQGDGLSVGRSYRDAPEVDGLVLVPGDLPVSEIAPVQITGATEYDLFAEIPQGSKS